MISSLGNGRSACNMVVADNIRDGSNIGPSIKTSKNCVLLFRELLLRLGVSTPCLRHSRRILVFHW